MSGDYVYDFTWKGKSAYTDFGIETMEISSMVIAERRDDTHVIPGRSGLVHDQDGAVEEVEQQLKIYLPYAQQGSTAKPFRDIRKWLKGYGKLTLSSEPGYYRMAWITDMIGLDPVLQGFEDLEGSIIFRCAPWLYHENVTDITLTAAAAITNPGTASSMPLITVNATGDIDLMIGGQTVLLNGLTGKIVLDCEAQEAYIQASDGSYTNLNAQMTGDFPELPMGSIPVSWSLGDSATLTSIVISPRWRDEN